MTLPSLSTDRLLNVYLTLNQYPMLSGRIRELMRQELFRRGVIKEDDFRQEVVRRAVLTQELEGVQDPWSTESNDMWEARKAVTVNSLTDQYFASQVPFEVLTKLIEQALREKGAVVHSGIADFNPETAPIDVLFNQGIMIEKLPVAERVPHEARLHEIKVVLIRQMISDQLRYINIAKDWFTVSDLAEIRRHKIGLGRIGGKAAGMLLAARILKEQSSPVLRNALRQPTSFYIGSDVIYTFMSINNLMHWNDQKYKDEQEMHADYPMIVEEFEKGEFPPSILQHFETILSMAAGRPLIVRSSSLLEDNFGTAFAGKYDSIFVPNQDQPEVNLRALTNAIARIYASTLNPAALVYRKSRGLLDYDERMGLLIQIVEGSQQGDFFFPTLAGVAFSENVYRWHPQIRAEDGFLRLVWGLGTRAVDRVGNDYPRLVALSHPTLNPSSNSRDIRRYSQQFIDLINLETNRFETWPVAEVIGPNTPFLRYLAQVDDDGYIHSLRSNLLDGKPSDLVLTFAELLKQTSFPDMLREMLEILESVYRSPVDIEFTGTLHEQDGQVESLITLIQCRPLSQLQNTLISLPTNIADENKVFTASSPVAGGAIHDIDYILYVSAEGYFSLKTQDERQRLERAIGRLNDALAQERYISVGPGRWGSSTPDLGIHISYADIFNTKALVELSGAIAGIYTEPSLGTHFFQDLLEGQIYPLAIRSGEDHFNQTFFTSTPNRLLEWIEADPRIAEVLKVIRVSDFKPGASLELVMDNHTDQAIAFLR